jgi:hypothetical protein
MTNFKEHSRASDSYWELEEEAVGFTEDATDKTSVAAVSASSATEMTS